MIKKNALIDQFIEQICKGDQQTIAKAFTYERTLDNTNFDENLLQACLTQNKLPQEPAFHVDQRTKQTFLFNNLKEDIGTAQLEPTYGWANHFESGQCVVEWI